MSHQSLSQRESIIISGFGLVSPMGHSAWETFSSLLAGRTLTDRAAAMSDDTDPVDLVRAVGSVSIARHTRCDPVVEIAERAAREALQMAGAQPSEVDCVVGTSKGAMHALLDAVKQGGQQSSVNTLGPPPVPDAHLAVVLGPHGYLAHHLGNRLGCNPLYSIVAACATSLTALHHAKQMLLCPHTTDRPSRVLVVTAEASLLPLFIHSYRRLGVLPPLSPDGYRGRPLDHSRCGFVLSEIAAAVVLERVDQSQPSQIELINTADACEAHDLVRAAPAMPALARVAARLLDGCDIDLLHPHATGTAGHDAAELTAIGPNLRSPTDVYACKGALGHGLGAAGLASLVIACLCARTSRRPPMPWLTDRIDVAQTKLRIARDAHDRPLNTHAVFAAGFGGHVAAALIKKH